MTLLNFGLFKPQEPQASMRDALKGICDTYLEYSWPGNIVNASSEFMRLINHHKPDVVFMQVQTPNIVTGKMLKKFPKVKFFNFSGDVRESIPAWYFDVAPYVTTLFTNTDWVEAMTVKGHRARYFQVGFDHNIYKPDGPKAETNPVVFMGNNHGSKFELSKLREEMVKRFSGKDWFRVYGRGWKNGIDLNYKQEQEAAVYRSAKIGINLSHIDLGSYTSDRMFRLMGSGCMCLAYRHKDIEKEFIDGFYLKTWANLDDLAELILYYLDHEDKRAAIARQGCGLVHEKYTWPARLEADLKPLL